MDTERAQELDPGRSAGAGVLSPEIDGRRQQGPLVLPLIRFLPRSQGPEALPAAQYSRGATGIGAAGID